MKSINPASGATTGANLIIETASLSNQTSTTWNSNQLYLKNDGKIGIGSSTPTSYLTINTPGGSTYNGGSTGNHAIIIGSQSPGFVALSVGTDETLTAAYLQSAIRGGASTPILLNPQGGNIGIGVTSPAAKLHAVTNTGTIPLIIATGSTTVDLVRITQVGTGNAFVVEDGTNPDSSPFVIDNAGNVGIGLSSPGSFPYKTYISSSNGGLFGDSATRVGVYGRTNATGGLGAGVEALAYGDDTGTYYGLKSSAYPADTPFIGNTYVAGYFFADGYGEAAYSLRLQDGTQGANKILTSVNASGDANWKSDIIVTSIVASASSTSDLVRITQTGTGKALVVEDSTNPDLTPFVIDAGGNVGVGTASPTTMLHVFSTSSGSVRIVDGTQQSGYVLTSDANGVATWQAPSGGGGGTNVTTPGNNRVVTSDGTSTGLVGEANLNFDGNHLGLTGSFKVTGTFSGNTDNFVQSELITQTVLLYMANNT